MKTELVTINYSAKYGKAFTDYAARTITMDILATLEISTGKHYSLSIGTKAVFCDIVNFVLNKKNESAAKYKWAFLANGRPIKIKNGKWVEQDMDYTKPQARGVLRSFAPLVAPAPAVAVLAAPEGVWLAPPPIQAIEQLQP